MTGSGGGPLSEELEAKINALTEWLVRNVGWVPEKDDGVIARLRAFARETQEPLETRLEDVYVKDRVKTREINILVPECRRLEAALLASQESERALRQKLTSLESVDKRLTDARESEKRLAGALEATHARHPHPELCSACALLGRKA